MISLDNLSTNSVDGRLASHAIVFFCLENILSESRFVNKSLLTDVSGGKPHVTNTFPFLYVVLFFSLTLFLSGGGGGRIGPP